MFVGALVGNVLCCVTKGHNINGNTHCILLDALMQLIAGLTLMISRMKVLLHFQFQLGALDC